MPIVNITTMKGALDEAQKKELYSRLTDLMVEIEGRGNEMVRKYVIISIREEEPINMGVGGQAATPEFVTKITGK